MPSLRRWGFKRLGGKKGFTLIELLIVLVILAILAGVIVMAVGGVFGTTEEQAYNAARDQLQTAAVGYVATNTSTSVDDLQTGANNSLNICLLLGSVTNGLLREVPDGARAVNCNSGACSGCADTNHYDWRIDDNGNVASVCVGAECTLATDGYQDVWP
ncbi:MAG TPA: type II secretion system protein [Dehalococcoidia bacterium]|nr:type II secretion system protein [Dehalococcoidia bacterium]